MKQKIWSLEAGSDRSQLKRSDAEAKIGDAHLKKSANKCTAKAKINARTSLLFVPLVSLAVGSDLDAQEIVCCIIIVQA